VYGDASLGSRIGNPMNLLAAITVLTESNLEKLQFIMYAIPCTKMEISYDPGSNQVSCNISSTRLHSTSQPIR
jgi:hypothetical protein